MALCIHAVTSTSDAGTNQKIKKSHSVRTPYIKKLVSYVNAEGEQDNHYGAVQEAILTRHLVNGMHPEFQPKKWGKHTSGEGYMEETRKFHGATGTPLIGSDSLEYFPGMPAVVVETLHIQVYLIQVKSVADYAPQYLYLV